MLSNPTSLLVLYCLCIAGFSLLGGLLPNWVQLTHTRTQLVMSLVSGLMLGVAFYHLLPHSLALLDHADEGIWWLMLGLVAMFLLLRLFHFHQHDFSWREGEGQSEGDQATLGAHHDREYCQHHAHNHTGSSAEPATAPHGTSAKLFPVHGLSWAGVAAGLALHTLIDGIALGAVMHRGDATAGILGVGVFLAILLHKPLDSLSIAALMRAAGSSQVARGAVNLGFALMCPLGALLFYFGVDLFSDGRAYIVGASLAFSAGAFICIALSDLLPEVHFHSHDRLKLTVAFLLGIAAAYLLGALEPPGLH